MRACILLLVSLFVVMPSFAGVWQNAWKTQNQQAVIEFAKKDFKAAAKKFTNSKWRGAAEYRAGNFQDARETFSNDKSAQGQYNLGNSLAHLGRLQQAIKAYDNALSQQPQFADAKYNRDLLEKMLKQQQKKQKNQKSQLKKDQKQSQQQQSQQQQQKQNASNQGQQQNQEQKKQDMAQQKKSQQQKDKQKKEQAKMQKSKESADKKQQKAGAQQFDKKNKMTEKQQATKQWLQQIPDDPGGLLRAKFYRDHQRYLQEQY